MTVCADVNCSVLIPASCWCWDHLRVCVEDDEPDCCHPAHTHEDPEHFCETHGGPG
jgi:hypothetical protein